ncbi:MAG: tripartite tricarboxylate transporter substrate binding protein [Betaproteobacteria bacterium]|nr:tripartite tricarboxylate transporter substrate binding protein [Betaproteobacteria bacterium]
MPYGFARVKIKNVIKSIIYAIVGGAVPSAAAQAQAYPQKPIRMIVAVPPGGPADTLARMVGPRLAQSLGQAVVIDNRPGANGNIAYEMAARSAPDGYTFALAAAGVAINPSLYREVRFDPVKDFAAITQGIVVPNILIVHPSLPAASVKELIALGRAKPVNFASAGNGTTGHLALEQFRLVSGMNLTHVPYKGGGPALAELMAGQVQALFSLALAALPQIKAGKARALAISSAKRSPVAPQLPTVAELGFPGFEVIGWFGWIAPAHVPPTIVARLNAEMVKVLRGGETQERLIALGSEPVGNTPREFAAFIAAERDKWAGVIKQANIRLD